MKKIVTSITAVVLMFTLISSVSAVEAIPTSSKVLVNGVEVKTSAYNIEGNNYFKLRDVAYMLNGTPSQFDVGYNSVLNSIVLTSKQSYTSVGGEMSQGVTDMKNAATTDSTVIKDDTEVEMQAYNIDGNNYFKLRDLGEKLNFEVEYDENTNSVIVESAKENNKKDSEDIYLEADTYMPNRTPEPPLTVPAP